METQRVAWHRGNVGGLHGGLPGALGPVASIGSRADRRKPSSLSVVLSLFVPAPVRGIGRRLRKIAGRATRSMVN
ncbi:hypothetical protein DYI42_09070 [Vannielia litorea]|nr:hypothetical protein [Vannielia litorea]